MHKLKTTEVSRFREQQLAKQDGVCAICLNPIKPGDDVLDHCHTTGEVRGVLHRGCNSMLGKIENHMRIARLTGVADLSRFLSRVPQYIFKKEHLGVLYPTHKTDEEKRLRRNKLARKRRAAAKETT